MNAKTFGDTVRSSRGLAAAEVPDLRSAAALMVIDVTNFDAHPEHGFARFAREEGMDLDYYWDRVANRMMPNLVLLLEAFRASIDARGRCVAPRSSRSATSSAQGSARL